MTDYRQRFFIDGSPVRGDVVKLTNAYQAVIAQKPYPQALQALLGEMLVSASLLMSTIKIDGRLSIQLQATGDTLLDWAMAECDHNGAVRALAGFKADGWDNLTTADDAFGELGNGVLFINIHQNPIGNKPAESYQGIVERVSGNLGECLAHYQKQSAQIPTFIKLATSDTLVSGVLIQLLPQSDSDKEADPDLWERVRILASTLKTHELTDLPANEILYRLYHEEEVILPETTPLHFGCTCSTEKSETAIINLGKDQALDVLAETGEIALDCGFCGTVYRFDKEQVERLFG